jgi:DNA-binding NarL/FixJ family response regulator
VREEPETKPADITLTSRQFDVLALMMQGKSNKAICRTLNLAVPTVKNHITAILKLLNVSNRTEAVIQGNRVKKFVTNGRSAESVVIL